MTQVTSRFGVEGIPHTGFGPKLFANKLGSDMAQGQGAKVHTLVMDVKSPTIDGNPDDAGQLTIPEGSIIETITLHTTETYDNLDVAYNVGYRSLDLVDFEGDAFFDASIAGVKGNFQEADGDFFPAGLPFSTRVVTTTNGVGIVISISVVDTLGLTGTIYLEITYRTPDDRAQNPQPTI